MHVHTVYSDSSGSVKEIIKIAKDKGLDGIAITDHHTLQGVWEAKRVEKDMLIIPGEEISTDLGEILAFGISKPVPEGLPIEHVIRTVHLQGGLVFVPHPTIPFFGRIKPKVLENLPIDGIEVFSAISPLSNFYASKSISLAKRMNLPMIAGSDSHFPETVGDAYTIIDAEDRTLSSVLEALRNGRTKIEPNPSSLKYKVRMLKAVLKKMICLTFRA